MSRLKESSSDYSDDSFDDIEKIESSLRDKCKMKNEITYNHLQDKVDLSYLNSEKRRKDKSDRATTDGVLDRRSKNIIFKLINQEYFDSVEGCISTGKEANVYRAVCKNGNDFVLKIYGTSIMKFKARNQYMEGDFRLKHASYKSSNTKLVIKWAEKEHRNLKRICRTNGAIPCPTPILQKSMVLLMSLIGNKDVAAPRLKDVEFEDENEWKNLYFQVVRITRILFQECKLVHADLSEYNLLYFDNKVWMIDVSQSVEHEHPNVIKFLLKDCFTINNFFRRKNVKTLLLQEYFNLVVDINFGSHLDENFDDKINDVIENTKYPNGIDDEECFLNSKIPRNLGEVSIDKFYEYYKGALKNPDYAQDNMPFLPIVGLVDEFTNLRKIKQQEKKNFRKLISEKLAQDNKFDNEKSDSTNSKSCSESNSDSEENITDNKESNNRFRGESPNTRKIRKQKIKEERKVNRMMKKDQKLKWDMKIKRSVKKKTLNFES